MEDHFWPAVYPGIIIGLLLALPARSLVSAVAGAIGGFCGAAVVYAVCEWAGIQGDFIRLAGLVGGSAFVAYVAIRLAPLVVGSEKQAG